MDRTVGTVGIIVALIVVAGVIFYVGGGGTVETPSNGISTVVVETKPSAPVPVPANPPFIGSAPVSRTLAANGIARTSVNLNGEVIPNGATTQFWFEYGTTANLGSATTLASVGDGTAKLPVSLSISGLNSLTNYWFRLNAQNQFGTVSGAILTFKTAGPSAQNAPTVTTTNVTDIGVKTASVHGTVNPNGLDTAYWFEYGTDSVLGSVLMRSTERKQVGAGTAAFTVGAGLSGLNPKTTYYFRIVAENAQGITYGARKSFKTIN